MNQPAPQKIPPKKIALGIALGLALVGGIYVFAHRYDESTDDAALDGRVVMLSPKISGYVKNLNIDDNQMVHAGDVLLEIDPADYITRRDHAAAALAAAVAAASGGRTNAETTSVSAPSNLDAAQAQVNVAQANLTKAENDLKRMQSLSREARSQEQLDQAIVSEKTARSNLDDAQARLRNAQTAPKAIAQAEATRDQLAAQVRQAQADLAQAELDLANTKITAPMDGHVTRRSVERGNYIQPGQSLGSLVSSDMWVTANFKENQLAHMRVGQHVDLTLDAYPNLKLTGKIDSIQAGTGAVFSTFPAENATGNFVKIVQRVPVKIMFEPKPDPGLMMGLGMSVTPTVDTSSSPAASQ